MNYLMLDQTYPQAVLPHKQSPQQILKAFWLLLHLVHSKHKQTKAKRKKISTVKATPKGGGGRGKGEKREKKGERRGEGRGRGRKGKRRGGGGKGIREGERREKRGQEGKITDSLLHPFPSTTILHPFVS